MQNERNPFESFFGKDEILVNFDFKAKNIIIFTLSITTNFKTDRCLNDFQRTSIWVTKTEKIPNATSKFHSHVKTRLLNMTCLFRYITRAF